MVLEQLRSQQPFLWLNPHLKSTTAAAAEANQSPSAAIGMQDIEDAEARLKRFAPLLMELFPSLKTSDGIIESELLKTPAMQAAIQETLQETLLEKRQEKMQATPGTAPSQAMPGTLWIKADHSLPIAGSIKARGGIYEVLYFAETLALEKGLLKDVNADYRKLNTPEARAVFEQYTLSVGSTGNLGLSIGLMSAALGFNACVHMSVEAKQWKKDRLRKQGVTVVEHSDDYSNAVAAGRAAAEQDPYAYFVDDENSLHLFLGYSVAALRLKNQLQAQGVVVDHKHPLFVYLPCGVGGAPGGITFGLKQVFGDAVHCFFAEPTQAPCMLLGMATGFKDNLTVYDVGLTIATEADGLAVGQASGLVGELMNPLLAGIFTVDDDRLFKDLYQLKQTEGYCIEPSAAAGFSGPVHLLGSEVGRAYLNKVVAEQVTKQVTKQVGDQAESLMASANHLVWTTGGSFVPEHEYEGFYQRGKGLVEGV